MISILTTVQIQVPEAMKPYITNETTDAALQRNVLLLYPYILKRKISHGKAAEILGIHKLDLIELYGHLDLLKSYFGEIQIRETVYKELTSNSKFPMKLFRLKAVLLSTL